MVALKYPTALENCGRPIVRTVGIQFALFILTGMLMDGGFSAGIVGLGALGHWLYVLIITVRRPQALTRTDYELLRFGYVLFMGVAFLACLVATRH